MFFRMQQELFGLLRLMQLPFEVAGILTPVALLILSAVALFSRFTEVGIWALWALLLYVVLAIIAFHVQKVILRLTQKRASTRSIDPNACGPFWYSTTRNRGLCVMSAVFWISYLTEVVEEFFVVSRYHPQQPSNNA